MEKLTKIEKKKILMLCIVVAFGVILYFAFLNFNAVSLFLGNLFGLFMPFIIGFGIAFFLTPLMEFIENKVFGQWNCKGKSKHHISAILALLIGIGIITLLLWIIVPSFINSITDLITNSESYINDFTKIVSNFVDDNDLQGIDVKSLVGSSNDIFTKITAGLNSLLPSLLAFSYQFIKGVFNALIAIISALYMLMDKEKFLKQCRKLNYALFPKRFAKYVHHVAETARNVFYDFVIGKAVDSLIIGILCYIGMSLLGLEYAGLLSVIVGVTNMIPVFGPFIGAVPGFFILLIVHPIDAVVFAVFILVLQQLDGNVIGPLILGDKLGLPSFWILFSVTFGGAFFGIVGMFLGVPIFALFYFLLKDYINDRLNKKNIDV